VLFCVSRLNNLYFVWKWDRQHSDEWISIRQTAQTILSIQSSSNLLFVLTLTEIHRSDDGGDTWQVASANPPTNASGFGPFAQLVFSEDANFFLASTSSAVFQNCSTKDCVQMANTQCVPNQRRRAFNMQCNDYPPCYLPQNTKLLHQGQTYYRTDAVDDLR